MIPQQRLSTQLLFAPTEVTNPQPSPSVSNQLGGVALQDATQGLSVKVWTAEVIFADIETDPNDIVISAPDVDPVVVLSGAGITEVSLAFDQNMRYFLAYVQAGVAKFYWYDSFVEAYVITELPGATSPRATLDDHRLMELSSSDIILAYIRDGNLCFRAQRDRYEIEYVLYPDINVAIISPSIRYVCMNTDLRLQFEIRGNLYGG